MWPEQRGRVVVEPGQRGNHRGKNAGEQDGDFGDRMKIKFIRRVDGFFGGEIRAGRRRQHQAFAQKRRLVHKHRAEDDGQKKQVRQAVKPPGSGRGFIVRALIAGAREKLIWSTT